MSAGAYRLPEGDAHRLGGTWITRTRPLTFRIDGWELSAYEGDTILSALLANGIDGAGVHDGQTLALSARFAPPVVAAGASDEAAALPMERTPVWDGADFRTLGGRAAGRLRRALARLGGGARRSLDYPFARRMPLPGPWIDLAPAEEMQADLLVIGAGIAGLSAACTAAREGAQVILAEREQGPGGVASLFAAGRGEEDPETVLPALIAEAEASGNIRLLPRTEVLHLLDGQALAHRVLFSEGRARGGVLRITAARTVIATGTIDRLPIFSGNRQPGVTGGLSAYQLASRFGVWPGRSAVFLTAVNQAYRLAILAAEAGVEVVRIADTRFAPRSRFLEFAKAHGFTLATGLVPEAATGEKGAGRTLSIALTPAHDEAKATLAPLHAERLVVCGGWQPEITLWQRAGGAASWNAAAGRIEAAGPLDGVALAGACAGIAGLAASVASGAWAADALFGRAGTPSADAATDTELESPDGSFVFTVPPANAAAPAYLDDGTSLAVFEGEGPGRATLTGAEGPEPFALGLGDVGAKVIVGDIAPEDAQAIAEERCVVPVRIAARAPAPVGAQSPDERVAPYLASRFGSGQTTAGIVATDRRRLDQGALVFRDTDTTDPRAAVGVVLGPSRTGDAHRALVAGDLAQAGTRVVVRTSGGAVSAETAEAPTP